MSVSMGNMFLGNEDVPAENYSVGFTLLKSCVPIYAYCFSRVEMKYNHEKSLKAFEQSFL